MGGFSFHFDVASGWPRDSSFPFRRSSPRLLVGTTPDTFMLSSHVLTEEGGRSLRRHLYR